MRILFVFILSIFTINSQAEIHTWVDDNGKKHFSDSLPDHLKHKTSTVDYSSSTPTSAQREEANRIYNQSKKHADGIPKKTTYTTNVQKDSNSTEKNVEKKKHLTRNDKIRLRHEAEAKACNEYLAAKRCSREQARIYGIDNQYLQGDSCGNLKRPKNC